MTITLRQKILVIFLGLTLTIIFATSGVYYYLIVKDIHEISRQQTTSAFKMMFDEFALRAKLTIPRVEQFLEESLAAPVFFLDRDEQVYTKNEHFNQAWDDADTQTWVYIQRYLKRLSAISGYLEKIAPVLDIHQMSVYDKTGRTVVVYWKDGEREQLGMYLDRFQGGIFISLLNEHNVEAITTLRGLESASTEALPFDIPKKYDGKSAKQTQVELSRMLGQLTLKFTAPILRNGDFQGTCQIHLALSQEDIERYSSFSQTMINMFSGTTMSIGALPEYTEFVFDDDTSFHHFDLLDLGQLPEFEFSRITLNKQQYYQGSLAFQDEQTGGKGAITALFARHVERAKVKELLMLIAFVTFIVGVLTTGVIYILSSAITRPVTGMTKLLRKITEGDLEAVMKDSLYIR